MSTEENKDLVRRCWLECLNKRNLAIIDELVAPEYVWHGLGQEVSGPEGIKQLVTIFLTAFPDLQMTFDDQFSEGEKIASRWIAQGTHQGDLFGIPLPASRRRSPELSSVGSLAAESPKNGRTSTSWACCNSLALSPRQARPVSYPHHLLPLRSQELGSNSLPSSSPLRWSS